MDTSVPPKASFNLEVPWEVPPMVHLPSQLRIQGSEICWSEYSECCMSLGKPFQLSEPPSSHLSNTIMLQPQTGDDNESWGPGDITVCNVRAPLPGFGLHTVGVEETLSLPACIHNPCGWTGKAYTQQTRPSVLLDIP